VSNLVLPASRSLYLALEKQTKIKAVRDAGVTTLLIPPDDYVRGLRVGQICVVEPYWFFVLKEIDYVAAGCKLTFELKRR
jgi:hypothetical protein